jgi:hypothetical protein
LPIAFIRPGWCTVVSPYTASLVAKKKANQLYYYVVESARVHGQPRIVRQTYLGSAEKVAALVRDRTAPHPPVCHRPRLRAAGGAVARRATHGRPRAEWVHNDPDIDKASVVWAHEMNEAANRELLRYFHDRRVWLLEPDQKPPRLSPYPITEPAQ